MSNDLEPDIDRLWADYKSEGRREQRDQLIVHYSPLVKYVAGRVATGLPQSVDQADLVSYGIFGLIDAIEKFDLGRGFKFETYAIARIKGNILDELRSIDWVPRSVRAKARALEKAYSKLEGELRRTPTDAELADELDLTEEQLQTTLGQISFTGLVALDEMLSGGDRGESATLGDTLPDSGVGPGGRLRGRGDAPHPRRRHQPPSRAGEDGPLALLLRGSHPRGDRFDPRGHGEPGVPDPHQGRDPAPVAHRRVRARTRLTARRPLRSSLASRRRPPPFPLRGPPRP